MSGLARLCLDRGATVSGADNHENDQTRALAADGATIRIGEHPELVDHADLLIYSSAVSDTHIERLCAAERCIPSIRRGTLLAHLTHDAQLLAVAGTHGKTTTSSMLALATRAAGLDPTILVGGNIPMLGSNAISGNDLWFVAETDESDGSFLELEPYLAIVTNVEDDHLDHYGDVGTLRNAFVEFIASVQNPEYRILCGDCAHLHTLGRRHFGYDYLTYGFSEWCDIRGVEIELESFSSHCTVMREGERLGRIDLNIPGIHMLCNALGVFAAGLALGLSTENISAGIAAYSGTRRRFERLGTWRGATLVDDYAHHPTEITATLQSLRQYTDGRKIVVFQPHRYSRTDQLFDRFVSAFGGIDLLVVSEIYSAGEEPRPGVTARNLIPLIQGVHKIVYAPHLSDVEQTLRDTVEEGDVIVFVGAGDINQVARKLLQENAG
jgi:UDP-N-acetylmuramate--alanine ligase